MTTIREFFVTAKHWQLFPAFVAILLFIFYAPIKFGRNSAMEALIFSFCILALITWYWSIASFLRDILPLDRKPKSRLLAFACIYAVLYVPVSFTLLPKDEPSFRSIPYWLSVLYILCIYYIFIYICLNLARSRGIYCAGLRPRCSLGDSAQDQSTTRRERIRHVFRIAL